MKIHLSVRSCLNQGGTKGYRLSNTHSSTIHDGNLTGTGMRLETDILRHHPKFSNFNKRTSNYHLRLASQPQEPASYLNMAYDTTHNHPNKLLQSLVPYTRGIGSTNLFITKQSSLSDLFNVTRTISRLIFVNYFHATPHFPSNCG